MTITFSSIVEQREQMISDGHVESCGHWIKREKSSRERFTTALAALSTDERPNRRAMLGRAIDFCRDEPGNSESGFDIHLAVEWLGGKAGWNEQQWMAYYDGAYNRAA